MAPDASGVNVRFARRGDRAYLEREMQRIRRDRLARKIDAKDVIVAERDEQPVGLLHLDFIGPDTPYMALIRVDPAHRRLGVGSALLGFAEDALRRRGFRVLFTSATGNEPEPQAWHRPMGFVECGSVDGFNEGGVAEVFFRKELERGPTP